MRKLHNDLYKAIKVTKDVALVREMIKVKELEMNSILDLDDDHIDVTPLMCSSMHGNAPVQRAVLESRPDIDHNLVVEDRKAGVCVSALSIAIHYHNVETLEVLLEIPHLDVNTAPSSNDRISLKNSNGF